MSRVNPMRTLVLGAAGPTGRHLVDLALAAGHDVTAVVRRPPDAPLPVAARLVVVDATDTDAVADVVAGHDAVLSSLGTRPSRSPVTLYSVATAAVVAGMRRHHVSRLIVVGSAVLDPGWRPSGEWFFNTVLDPLVNRRVARTAHDDMRRMEALLAGPGVSDDIDWTVARPSGLFDHPVPTRYQVAPGTADGLYTARVDLAAAMVAELTDRRFVHRPMGVITTDVRPTLVGLVRREVLGRAG